MQLLQFPNAQSQSISIKQASRRTKQISSPPPPKLSSPTLPYLPPLLLIRNIHEIDNPKYYNVTINGRDHRDLLWWYRYPTQESIFIAGTVAPYNEKVDIYVDDQLQERPKTKFG